MSYKNKTYVIFDGEDINNYYLMKAWKSNENIDFNFYDAHDTREIRSDSEVESVKQGLRERFATAKQVIVLVGENTKHKHRFVRWEIEVAEEKELPIIVANLNGKRTCDYDLCPPILKTYYAVHVSFQPAIIQYALDNFPAEFSTNHNNNNEGKIREYGSSIYQSLGL